MSLRSFPLLTDENIHSAVLAFLEGEGFDVLDVKRAGLVGSTDQALMTRANAEGRVILTHDSDFGTLAFTMGTLQTGILYLRPGHIDPGFTIGTLRTLLTQDLALAQPFLIVAQRSGEDVRFRLRHAFSR